MRGRVGEKINYRDKVKMRKKKKKDDEMICVKLEKKKKMNNLLIVSCPFCFCVVVVGSVK